MHRFSLTHEHNVENVFFVLEKLPRKNHFIHNLRLVQMACESGPSREANLARQSEAPLTRDAESYAVLCGDEHSLNKTARVQPKDDFPSTLLALLYLVNGKGVN